MIINLIGRKPTASDIAAGDLFIRHGSLYLKLKHKRCIQIGDPDASIECIDDDKQVLKVVSIDVNVKY